VADTIERRPHSTELAWQRVDTLLDQLGERLENLHDKSSLIGPELVAGLRAQHDELRRELNTLRDAYPESGAKALHVLDRIKERADQLAANTRREARSSYERLRTVAKDPRTGQALKEGLGDIGRGAMRAGRELGGALGSALARFRQDAQHPDQQHRPEGRDRPMGEPPDQGRDASTTPRARQDGPH
jgi:hypothetical protein